MLVLGIETSCDETGVALYDSDAGLLGNLLHSQVDLHSLYGGVVPELASRDHIRRLVPMTTRLLAEQQFELSDLNGVAYTAGPGLLGAVMVGATFGRALAFALDIPAVGVHHMEAHLLAPLMHSGGSQASAAAAASGPRLPMPFIALLVSGGHTQLVQVDGLGCYRLLGESIDDAAGEAFDKVAKMLGLGYPGGPAVAALAATGDPDRFRLPRPMTDRPGLDFSFSGLKTAARTLLARLETAQELDDQARADVARAFEEAAVDTLVIKCQRALSSTGIDHLVLAGGVSANLRLRERLAAAPQVRVHVADPALCTDNGAMVAFAGCQRLLAGQREPLAVRTRARWPMTELTPPQAAQDPAPAGPT